MRKLLLVTTLILFMPVAVLAQEAGSRSPGHKRHFGKNIMRNLDLTKDQLNKMRELRHEMRKQSIKLRSALELATIDFQDELQKEKPDDKKLSAFIDTIVEAKSKMEQARLETQVDTIRILTPEQKKKMIELMGAAMLEGNGKFGKHNRRSHSNHDRD